MLPEYIYMGDKHQIPNSKYQINSNVPNSNSKNKWFGSLGIGICLGFGILNHNTPSRGIKHAIREKQFPPE
jgi:hypothetical protein